MATRRPGSARPVKPSFEDKLAQLRRYAAHHGHARPAKRYVTNEGYQLGRWVFHLRDADRRHYLSSSQEAMLEALPGWTWQVDKPAPASAGAWSWKTPRLEHLRGRNVVLLDMDATLFDPWSCPNCGFKERSLRASKDKAGRPCTHVRHDTLAKLQRLVADHDALVVVCSYRHGRLADTRAWVEEDLAHTGLRPAAYVLPGAPDDCSYQSRLHVPGLLELNGKDWGQVCFKAHAADALQKRWGAKLVGAFDDNATVCEAYRRLGALNVEQVPYLVEIKPWEWRAGYLGVPEPAPWPSAAPVLAASSARAGGAPEPRPKWGPSPATYYADDFADYGSGPAGFEKGQEDEELRTGFEAGDAVRFYQHSRTTLGEVIGNEDGYVVVMDETDRIVYLRPDEARKI